MKEGMEGKRSMSLSESEELLLEDDEEEGSDITCGSESDCRGSGVGLLDERGEMGLGKASKGDAVFVAPFVFLPNFLGFVALLSLAPFVVGGAFKAFAGFLVLVSFAGFFFIDDFIVLLLKGVWPIGGLWVAEVTGEDLDCGFVGVGEAWCALFF